MVITNGIVIDQAMRQNDLSEHDLFEDLKLNGNIGSPPRGAGGLHRKKRPDFRREGVRGAVRVGRQNPPQKIREAPRVLRRRVAV